MYTSSSTKNKTEPMTYFSYQMLENVCAFHSPSASGERWPRSQVAPALPLARFERSGVPSISSRLRDAYFSKFESRHGAGASPGDRSHATLKSLNCGPDLCHSPHSCSCNCRQDPALSPQSHHRLHQAQDQDWDSEGICLPRAVFCLARRHSLLLS